MSYGTDENVVALRDAKLDSPCVEAQKLRSVEDGKLVFDRWCIKHHHWLNDAPPCDDVTTAELKALRATGHNMPEGSAS